MMDSISPRGLLWKRVFFSLPARVSETLPSIVHRPLQGLHLKKAFKKGPHFIVYHTLEIHFVRCILNQEICEFDSFRVGSTVLALPAIALAQQQLVPSSLNTFLILRQRSMFSPELVLPAAELKSVRAMGAMRKKSGAWPFAWRQKYLVLSGNFIYIYAKETVSRHAIRRPVDASSLVCHH